jgi:hypothetical protein
MQNRWFFFIFSSFGSLETDYQFSYCLYRCPDA